MLAASTLILALVCQTTQEPTYDPLALPTAAATEPMLLTATDARRERALPLCVYLPSATAKAPVVLWSHGLGGNCKNSAYLGRHWAGRGYVAVFVQHPGSDDSVWKSAPPGERMAAMQQAASGQNLQLRCADVKFVLDQLADWNADAQHPLHRRCDLDRIGMSGHSFGAFTTQGVSGQSMPVFGPRWTDSRIDAALPMSPSSPRTGTAETAFAQVQIPWLLMTGTLDDSPIGGQTAASRREVFPALPATIDRYELVLHEAQHSAFSERALPGDRNRRNPNHHRTILALSTAFWDTHLRGDASARAWLHGDGARSVVQAQDVWQVAAANTAIR